MARKQLTAATSTQPRQDTIDQTVGREVSLTSLDPGQCAIVASIDAAAIDVNRLAGIGVCVHRPVELIQRGDPMILLACGCRVGLASRLAQQIRVLPCERP